MRFGSAGDEEKWKRNATSFSPNFGASAAHNRSLCGPSLVEVKENSPLIARQSTSGVILAALSRLGAME
jgi:hypothetical protein